MPGKLRKAFVAARTLGGGISVVKLADAVFAATGTALPAVTEPGLLADAWAVMMSTPVFAISLMLTGQWIGEIADAIFYRREGNPGWIGRALLRWRLAFTKRLVHRPFWYPNHDRVLREIDRTRVAMARAGFADLESRARRSGSQD